MLIYGRTIGNIIKNNRLLLSHQNKVTFIQSKKASGESEKPEQKEPEIPRNLLRDVYSASEQPLNGKIYDKKPFKIRLEKDKAYVWCLCGNSKTQPFCDLTHQNPYMKYKQRPVKFKVAETKDYWLCNCKQTKNRPFCDGTHKRPDIQEAVK